MIRQFQCWVHPWKTESGGVSRSLHTRAWRDATHRSQKVERAQTRTNRWNEPTRCCARSGDAVLTAWKLPRVTAQRKGEDTLRGDRRTNAVCFLLWEGSGIVRFRERSGTVGTRAQLLRRCSFWHRVKSTYWELLAKRPVVAEGAAGTGVRGAAGSGGLPCARAHTRTHTHVHTTERTPTLVSALTPERSMDTSFHKVVTTAKKPT